MKILFVDESQNLQEKWIGPLRNESWGVLRARSTEDAEKIFEFHGDSLKALVVSESHVEWAEKWNYPYVILLKSWKETQVMKHQNSSTHPAIAYLNFDSGIEVLKHAVQSVSQSASQSKNVEKESEVKATGTSATVPVPPQETNHEKSLVIEFDRYQDKTSTSIKIENPAPEKEETQILEVTTISKIEEIPPMEEPSQKIEVELSEEPEVSIDSFDPQNKDLETMKNYLALREQDVAVLTGQFRTSQERVKQLEMLIKVEKARNAELQHLAQKQEQQIRNYDRDKQVEFEVLHQQVEDLNGQLREKSEKVRTIEAKLKVTTDEVEKVKERVRMDIRRIRVREKELETQLEILKKDSTALLVARDEKITELKRKIDLLEFNMELVQEQYNKERNITEQLRHKLKEAASAMKRAGGLLDHEN